MPAIHDQDVESIDFETDILRRSPGLSEVKPHFGLVEDSPPPLVPYDPIPVSGEVEGAENARSPRRRKRRRKGRTRLPESDRILTSYLENNPPDISSHTGRHPLDFHAESETGGESNEI